MVMENKRRKFSAREKFELVKQAVTRAKTVAELCSENSIHPNQFYRWQKDFFEGAYERFNESKTGRKSTRDQRILAERGREVQRLNEVIAEVVKENIELKKKSLA